MSAYTRLVSGVLFPLQERLKRHDTVRVRRDLERTQWWTPEQLRDLQLSRLRRLLSQASEVPYYRDLFRTLNFDPMDIRSLDDLCRLPFLTKAIIRTNSAAMAHPQAVGLGRSSTGGSSGEPLVFGIGRARVSHDVAAKWRATRWWGVDIGDEEVVVWASPIELGAQDHARKWRDLLFRSWLLPAFDMSDRKLDEFLATLQRRRPKMLFGYPSALALVARHAQRHGASMADLGVRVAFTTGERLYDEQRTAIEQVFNCPVANGYGGRDAGFIAHQCPQGGLHLTAEDIVVELVDPEGRPVAPGTAGEVVVTHLASQDFPFIRYRTGDVAVFDQRSCNCGRGLPLLGEVQGRSNDFVVAANGTRLQSAALTYVLRDLPGIEAFKIIQETRQLVRLQLVVDSSFPPQGDAHIASGFRGRLGDQVDVQVEHVSHIAPEKSGKYRYIISHVDADVPAASAGQTESTHP